MKPKQKAELVLKRIGKGESISNVRTALGANKEEWFRISKKAYSLHLEIAQKRRNEDVKKPNVSATSNEEISEIIELNERLADLALSLPSTSTAHDFDQAKLLLEQAQAAENELISLIEGIILKPQFRALQNTSRLKNFANFGEFYALVEAATVSYYRGNYISAYLTLVPVIEGVILRWSGYTGVGKKPEFEEIRKFFSNSHVRAPCPGNPLFHQVFCKVCSKIINEHLYRPSQSGSAHSEFNRHQASHLLRNVDFATRENCVRLFLLLDTMAEIFLYETCCNDPRWKSDGSELKNIAIYMSILRDRTSHQSPESQLLGAL